MRQGQTIALCIILLLACQVEAGSLVQALHAQSMSGTAYDATYTLPNCPKKALYCDYQEWGMYRFGCRSPDQVVIQLSATLNGNVLSGKMTYSREGPIDFQGTITDPNDKTKFLVENKWPGVDKWQPGGTWIIGDRKGEAVQSIEASCRYSNCWGNHMWATIKYGNNEYRLALTARN